MNEITCALFLSTMVPGFILLVLFMRYRTFDRSVVRRCLAISTFVLFAFCFSYTIFSDEVDISLKVGLLEDLTWLVAVVFGFYFGHRVIDNWNMLKFIEKNPDLLTGFSGQKTEGIAEGIAESRAKNGETIRRL